MKKVIIMKLVSPPDIDAFISSGPSRERNSRSVKVMTVSHAWETTIGSAIARSSRTPPAAGAFLASRACSFVLSIWEPLTKTLIVHIHAPGESPPFCQGFSGPSPGRCGFRQW